ncbi:PLP-dependent aminotransferase family protein [Dechloromonas sp. A34]|uniref:MocR-like pyridoxine biosynthesis transcription factor PdxR n=1 Tax=Dechloromonas sp. A34 TaxID=447588 RepID=UPI0022487A2F|nr:PLP-dependent aminotransferase family protein [Dechloromonas sp. A34]
MSLSAILDPLNDPADAMPRQQQLYRRLKEAMLDGRLGPGARLPASRLLAADYGIARNTVLYAYQQLQAEGFLLADRRGTRVADLPVLHGLGVARPVASHAPAELSRRAAGLALRQHEPLLPFAPGVADLNAFPWAAWARQLQKAWGEVSARQLAYAAPAGEPRLRQALADDLRARRGVLCSPEQIFVVAGAQIALDACARLLADEGDTVWLENPCYPAARSVMQTAGLRAVHVPVDAAGMAPEPSLWESQPPRLVYLTPSHQYPLGAVLSLERRLEFLRRIVAANGWIIEDDYDSEFNHARPGYSPLPALQGLHADAPVVYVGTFSKLLYPGLRVAYMVVPRWAAREFGERIASLYRSGQAVEQRALAGFIESGALTRHLRKMAPIYRARQAVLRRELTAAFGDDVEILGGDAGLHLTLGLPAGEPDQAVIAKAMALGVTARPLSEYCAAEVPGASRNGLVLGYGMAEEKRIPELVARLARAVAADA